MSSSTKLFNHVLNQNIEGVRFELQNSNTRVDDGGARRLFWHYETPLQLAVELKRVDIVKLLLEAHANPHTSYGSSARTPLHTAISSNQCDVVRLLISCKVDVDARDINGETPLFLAWKGGINLLVEAYANVDAVDNRGLTPLIEAARLGKVEEVEMLLEHHAAVDAKDNRGLTPLMHAGLMCNMPPQGQRVVIAKMLLDNGADIFATSNDGRSALRFAADHPNHDFNHDFQNFIRLEMKRQKYTAFALSSHDRLGEGSQAAKLKEEMMKMIWEKYIFE
jgi:ankyrin repeat protein